MRPTIYLTVGCSGSGKSTFAKQLTHFLCSEIIEYDEMRKTITKDISSQEKNEEFKTKLCPVLDKLKSINKTNK